MNRKWIYLIIWIICIELIGAFMGFLTQENIATWYAGLSKSSLTPPGYVFSIVWSTLYFLLAVMGFILFSQRQQAFYKTLFLLFCLQMLMNFAWTPIFFQLHWIGIGLAWLLGMIIINGVIMVKSWYQARYISWLMLPYLLWLTFAAYLNAMIVALN